MKATTFELRLGNRAIPTFVRNMAQRALSTLRVNHEGTIETDESTFNLICKHAGVEPTKSNQFTFIRIYDEEDNSVDIQVESSLFERIGQPLRDVYCKGANAYT
jgi:hypothetical protein